MSRRQSSLLLVIGLLASVAQAAAPAVDVKETMVKIIEPTSNAVFYVSSEPPKSDQQWQTLQQQATRLLAAAKTLSKSPHAKEKQWQTDLKPLLDAAATAEKAALARNQSALEELNEPLYNACVGCHEHYLPKR